MMRRAVFSAAAAAVLAFSFCCAPAQLCTPSYTDAASAVSASYSTYPSVSEAGAYLRKCMTRRDTTIEFALPKDSNSLADIVDMLFLEAIKETGKGSEGDYLRLSVQKYDVSVKSNSTTRIFTFTMAYHTNKSQEEFVDKKASEVLNSLSLSGKPDYEKIGAIYDYVVKCADYAEDLTEPTIFSAYGALSNGSVVCQGYSQLLYRLLSDAGISCRTVLGTSNGVDHVWNIAELEGAYYLLDPTWDSNLGGTRNYFLRGSSDFDTIEPYTHTASTGIADNIVFRPDYTSAEFQKAYPIAEKAYVPGVVVKLGTSLGDLSGDDKITAIDASLLLASYASGKQLSKEFIAIADASGDGLISSVDASYILKYYAALNDGTKLSLAEYVSKEIRRES